MEKQILNLDSIVTLGKYNGKTVNEIIEKDRSAIVALSKKGLFFDDEVFAKARYTHIVNEAQFIMEIADRPKPKTIKPLKKDTENINKIIESLSTLENYSSNDYENEVDEDEDNETLYR